MRKLIVLLAIAMCQSTAIMAKAPKTPKTAAQQLMERLAKIQQKGVMYGHQDDPFYGLSWEWEFGRSDTKDVAGDYPAVMGFDLGGIEKGDEKNLDSVPFSQIRKQAQDQHRRGGIVTFSWHPRNPMIGTTAWIESDNKAYAEAVDNLQKIGQGCMAKKIVDPKTTVKSILPGGSHYDTFQLWLHRVAEFMSSVTDDNGQPIPVIFRPWHENTGGWFWWGRGNCSEEEYLALWNMTQDFIRQRLPESIVWSFSPCIYGNRTEAEWLAYYPGDDRVDLIGEDAYQWGNEEAFQKQIKDVMRITAKIAADHGKLFALTECGYANSPDPTWLSRVLLPALEGHPVCYFLLWRNWKKEHFGVAPETATAADFRQLAQQKKLLLVGDVKKVK